MDCSSSLQKSAKDYLLAGKRFATTGMMILKEEAYSGNIYYSDDDKEEWSRLVRDRRLKL